MADRKVQMPTSTAGLTRYFDDYRTRIELKPGHVLVLALAIVLIIALLHFFGKALIGA